MIRMVEPAHRRVFARAHAFDLFVAEEPVRRDLVRLLDADGASKVVDDLLGASKRAAEVGAHVKAVLADRLKVEQGVKGGDAFDIAGIEL